MVQKNYGECRYNTSRFQDPNNEKKKKWKKASFGSSEAWREVERKKKWVTLCSLYSGKFSVFNQRRAREYKILNF